MKLIFALGNPGAKYTHTRHNAGFVVLDAYAAAKSAHFQPKPKFHADIAEVTHQGEKILLVRPTTYYNQVGLSARALLDFYKLSLDDILVVHDDTDLDFGKIRIRQGGRDAGSNGLKSLHAHVGADFWHVRIGTDSLLRRRVPTDEFVLMNFNDDERALFREWVIPQANTYITDFLDGHLEATSFVIEARP